MRAPRIRRKEPPTGFVARTCRVTAPPGSRHPKQSFRLRLSGRVAQWESTVFTRRGSLVQSQPRPPTKSTGWNTSTTRRSRTNLCNCTDSRRFVAYSLPEPHEEEPDRAQSGRAFFLLRRLAGADMTNPAPISSTSPRLGTDESAPPEYLPSSPPRRRGPLSDLLERLGDHRPSVRSISARHCQGKVDGSARNSTSERREVSDRGIECRSCDGAVADRRHGPCCFA